MLTTSEIVKAVTSTRGGGNAGSLAFLARRERGKGTVKQTAFLKDAQQQHPVGTAPTAQAYDHPNRAVTQRSTFAPEKTITLDPWSANPLLDDAEQAQPALAAVAHTSNGEPPTLFESGPLPPFTASGVDPQHLTRLPFRTRHAAATESSPAAVLRMVETHGPNPDAQAPSPGLDEYRNRMSGWLRGTWTNPNAPAVDASTRAAAEGDLYDSMFGASDAATAAKRAPMNAAAADFAAQRAKTGKYSGIGKAQR